MFQVSKRKKAIILFQTWKCGCMNLFQLQGVINDDHKPRQEMLLWPPCKVITLITFQTLSSHHNSSQ